MNNFTINLNRTKGNAEEIKNISREINQLADRCEQLSRNLSSYGSSMNVLKSRLDGQAAKLRGNENDAKQLGRTLLEICRTYEQCENRILGNNVIEVGEDNKYKEMLKKGLEKVIELLKALGLIQGGTNVKTAKYAGDPVNMCTGDYVDEINELSFPNSLGLSFARYYNSTSSIEGSLGIGWSHSYECSIEAIDDMYVVTWGDGVSELFAEKEDGVYLSRFGGYDQLIKTESGFSYKKKAGSTYLFSDAGKLITIKDNNDNQINFEYSNGLLIRAVDQYENAINYEYDESAKLIRVCDSENREITFTYDNGFMTASKSIMGRNRLYVYDELGRLTNYRDSEGNNTFSIEYDDANRVIGQTFADGTSLEYRYGENYISIVNANGREEITYRDAKGRHVRTNDGIDQETYVYDDMNQRVSFSDAMGNTYVRTFDSEGNIESFQNPLGEITKYIYESGDKPVKVIKPDGNTVVSKYDSNGNLTSICDECGNVTSFEYEKYGKVSKIINPDMSEHLYFYDLKGNLEKEIDECGNELSYEYDGLGNRTAIIESNGNITTYSYDIDGCIKEVKNAAGQVRTFTYDEYRRVVKVDDFDGYNESWEYNKRGWITGHIDKAGNITSHEYDKEGNETRIILPNGGTITKEYDEHNKLKRYVNPDGAIEEYSYDANGNCTKIKRGEYEIAMEYDKLDRLTESSDNNGKKRKAKLNIFGLIDELVSEDGTKKSFAYDATGRCVSVTDMEGHATKYEYDSMGRLSSIINANDLVTKYEYYLDGSIKKVTYPDNTWISYLYDSNCNLIEKKNQEGFAISYDYDSINQISKVSNTNGLSLMLEYDAAGNIIKKTNGKNATTEYHYNPNGKVDYVRDALGNKVRYSYNVLDQLSEITMGNQIPMIKYDYSAGGRLLSRTDALGHEDRYVYDVYGNMIKHTLPDNREINYSYYNNGDVKSMVLADGRKASYKYDTNRRLIEVADWNGVTSIGYDHNGKVLSTVDAIGNSTLFDWDNVGLKNSLTYSDGSKMQYKYDEYGRLSGLTSGEADINYCYDANGRLLEKKTANNSIERYEYNRGGQISRLTIESAGDKKCYEYKYDLSGNCIERNLISDNENKQVSYKYDELNRIVEVLVNGASVYAYGYDERGNRIYEKNTKSEINYTYNPINQLIKKSEKIDGVTTVDTEYEYDLNGNLIVEKNAGGSRKYDYDSAGKLIRYSSENGEVTEYEYDALGNRIRTKTITDKGCLATEFVNDITKDYNQLLQIKENDKTINYLWDRNILAKSTKDGIEFYQCDENGSAISLTDAEGKVKRNYEYDTFGKPVDDKIDNEQPFGFTGLFYQGEQGSYYTATRNYRPDLGRFQSSDKDQFIHLKSGQSINLYTYCLNNPVLLVDLNGEDSYIFYLPEFKDEATNDQRQLAKTQYGGDSSKVHLIPITDNQSFTEGWNGMGTVNGKTVDIDTVVINTHANPQVLGYGENSGDKIGQSTISRLDNKDMDNLVLYGCNAGHMDYSQNNVAAWFSKKVNGAPVMASDGTVSPGGTFFNKTDRSYSSLNDSHYKDWLPEGSKRKNSGWVLYRYKDGEVQTGVVGDKKMTLTEMVKELNRKHRWTKADGTRTGCTK